MAFDPVQEDCLRLILANMERDGIQLLQDPLYIERATDVFQKDPSPLIHTDHERSFHLVAKATELIDYRAPFAATEAEAEEQANAAEAYLREAVELDPRNWDAQRMLATLQSSCDDELISYLLDHKQDVASDAAGLIEQASNPYEAEFARDLGQRPHQRWIAALASRFLIAGQYRKALSYAEEGLAVSPTDLAGVRHTGMLAMAKLEVAPEELQRYRTRHAAAYQITGQGPSRRGHTGGHKPDAWSLIAQMSLAYRAFDFAGATTALRTLMRVYPHAEMPLYFQTEFPDGAFARVNVQPGSEDELVIALSEATPLLQEGMGTPDSASFALWIAEHELVQQALGAQDAHMRPEAHGNAHGGEA